MTDIVERLRNGVYGINRIPLCAEAADEIERLRAWLREAGAAGEIFKDIIKNQVGRDIDKNIGRLRDQISEAERQIGLLQEDKDYYQGLGGYQDEVACLFRQQPEEPSAEAARCQTVTERPQEN